MGAYVPMAIMPAQFDEFMSKKEMYLLSLV